MPKAQRFLYVAVLGLVLGGCVSDSQYNKAITTLDAQWKSENDKALEENGHRVVQASKQQVFSAALRAAQRMSMIIEKQDYPTGYIFVSSSAPTPLTAEEWDEVNRSDGPKMKRIIRDMWKTRHKGG